MNERQVDLESNTDAHLLKVGTSFLITLLNYKLKDLKVKCEC